MTSVDFIKDIIRTELYSYRNVSSFYVGVAVPDSQINVAGEIEYTRDFIWELYDSNSTMKDSGTGKINRLGTFNIKIDLTNPPTVGFFYLKITKQGETREDSITTLFYGNVDSNFHEVDEFFKFDDETKPISIYGDLILDANTKKLKFPNDWRADRTYGNGVVKYGDEYYIFRPKNLFTHRTDIPPFIPFVPFTGFPVSSLKIHTIPRIKRINNFEYALSKPMIVKITYFDENYKEITSVISEQLTSGIKLARYPSASISFVFNLIS